MLDAPVDRRRLHAERMLTRAKKRRYQAEKLVAKWTHRIDELDRAGVAAHQAKLWTEEHSDALDITDTLAR